MQRHQPIGGTPAIQPDQGPLGRSVLSLGESHWIYNPVFRNSLDSFLSEQKTDISARKHELWLGLIQACLSPGTHSDGNEAARACSRRFCNGSWWGREQMGREGRRFFKSVDHSQCYEYKLQNWLQWSFNISAKAAIIFVWLSRFTNGSIQNKMSITTPLVTCRGTGVRNQIKAVLQVSQNAKIPPAENATD